MNSAAILIDVYMFKNDSSFFASWFIKWPYITSFRTLCLEFVILIKATYAVRTYTVAPNNEYTSILYKQLAENIHTGT